MADGTRVELDVLVYATGFDAHAYMRPMNVTGLNGMTIDEAGRRRSIPMAASRCRAFPICSCSTGRSPGQQRAGAAGSRPGDRLHHAADRRGPRPPRRGRADRRRDREIPRPPRRRLSRHRLGRRLQELVHRPAGHARPVAVAAERAQGVLRHGRRPKISSSSRPGRETDFRAGRVLPLSASPRAIRCQTFTVEAW